MKPVVPISSIQHYLFISLSMRKTDLIRMLFQPREQRRQEREDSHAASKHPSHGDLHVLATRNVPP
jgi:hypothetical protein